MVVKLIIMMAILVKAEVEDVDNGDNGGGGDHGRMVMKMMMI